MFRVVDIEALDGNQTLRIALNSKLKEAIGYLITDTQESEPADLPQKITTDFVNWSNQPNWRKYMAEKIAAQINPERFGIVDMYLIGSTKNNSVGPGSDIDLMIHVRNTPQQQKELKTWLEGWSVCLAEINYLKTGYRSEGLLDVHYITDESIAQKTSFTVMINAVTDAALKLLMSQSSS
jgi:predicted nucleotidyltransferase